MPSTCPVTHVWPGSSSHSMADATSSGSPMRPSGCSAVDRLQRRLAAMSARGERRSHQPRRDRVHPDAAARVRRGRREHRGPDDARLRGRDRPRGWRCPSRAAADEMQHDGAARRRHRAHRGAHRQERRREVGRRARASHSSSVVRCAGLSSTEPTQLTTPSMRPWCCRAPRRSSGRRASAQVASLGSGVGAELGGEAPACAGSRARRPSAVRRARPAAGRAPSRCPRWRPGPRKPAPPSLEAATAAKADPTGRGAGHCGPGFSGAMGA